MNIYALHSTTCLTLLNNFPTPSASAVPSLLRPATEQRHEVIRVDFPTLVNAQEVLFVGNKSLILPFLKTIQLHFKRR